MNIVWFKKDLRVVDHKPLVKASASELIALYIIEPDLWALEDMSKRQYEFMTESLLDLKEALRSIGIELTIRVGVAENILKDMVAEYNIDTVFAHEETSTKWVNERNQRVRAMLEQNNAAFQEYPQTGVVRHLVSRDGWAKLWYQFMQSPIYSVPSSLQGIEIQSDRIPTASELGLDDCQCIDRQVGGRGQGLTILHSFLSERGEPYTKAMSSPITAWSHCSRLSPYIAFGCISMREVFHATEARRVEIQELSPGSKGKWGSAIRSFSARLRWHCHFIQKLEDEPRIEYENLHTAYNGLRENAFNDAYFTAWKQGNTGYPMIDACMRSLIATGWLNFRMRAMLVSFASYHLWLDWRPTSKYLATLFTDYEPGIHYSQFQMQSGTTGINTLRIYNPIKQGMDHDPQGEFIRKWIPELAHMEDAYIHTPWECEAEINGYPMPIVDEKVARTYAREAFSAVRKRFTHKDEARKIVKKHGSRKRTNKKPKIDPQGELPLE